MRLTPDMIRRLPKCDLHLHLDGSLRIDSLIEMARKENVKLPSYTADGLRETVFRESYADLTEYLQGFQYTVAVLQNAENLERAAYELMEDNLKEGCRYIEVRFAPQLHVHDDLSWEDILGAVDRGLRRARDQFNTGTEGVRAGIEPPCEYGIIVCAMRKFEPFYSAYYQRLFDVFRFATPKEIFRHASLELARAVVSIRDRLGLPIVGFDLAGDESGWPAIDHREAFQFVHKNFMKKTVHAGEAFGPQSIFQAITELYADRIGHGSHLYHFEMIPNGTEADRAEYVERLGQFIADGRVTIEVCLSSNLQTDPGLGDLSRHPFGEMKRRRLSYTLGTDNRLVSSTDTCRELTLALRHFEFTRADLRNMLIYGFKRSFYPGPYTEKRQYVRKVINYYEHLERTCFPPSGDDPVVTA
ncbi:MAG: adenosine deaminase family protein [Acidobacteria bacterium]|nr:adenosine deaminase family protein [Acidobacteriota bacterium]